MCEFAKLRFVHANNNYVRNPTDETKAVYEKEKIDIERRRSALDSSSKSKRTSERRIAPCTPVVMV